LKLQEAAKNAYMIRNDGKVFDMIQHVYGSPLEVEETLAAAEWLYSATRHSSTKDLILNFISTWGYQQNPDEMTIVNSIHSEIDKRPYRFLSHEFIDSIADKLDESRVVAEIEDLNDLVVNELNQEFLRARYGGMYNSFAGSKELVFRVSSAGFNWFNIIFQFVYDNKNRVDCVTIVHDEEATGSEDVYTHNGEKIEKMPINDFIMMSGNPIIEELEIKYALKEGLVKGNSIIDSAPSKINYGRLNINYARALYAEHHDGGSI